MAKPPPTGGGGVRDQASKLRELHQAFTTADRDNDHLLNKEEFKEFVEVGYGKQCPEGMYENLCAHFKRDPEIGIDWKTARAVWLQAQGGASRASSPAPPSSAPSPSPGPPSAQSAQQRIKQAFIRCDKDADGFLNKAEFEEFVKVGFGKPEVPPGMYEQVCGHFKRSTAQGMDWNNVYTLWQQSNPPSSTASPTSSTSTQRQPRHASQSSSTLVSPRARQKPSLSNRQSSNLSPGNRQKSRHQLQSSAQGTQLTEGNLQKHTQEQRSQTLNRVRGDDEMSLGSSSSRRHRRAGSASFRDRDARGPSFDDGPDASQMVVQMMEGKVKSLQQQLKLERTKRKKTEELAQSLLNQVDDLKKHKGELEAREGRMAKERKADKEQLRKLKSIVDDDRATIKHLKTQFGTVRKEKDEYAQLLTKIEQEHAKKVKKATAKHKAEMQKLMNGFMQSLGAEPGTDPTAVIQQLKTDNSDLQNQVDVLAETLARKEQSLFAALQAVDSLAMEDEKSQFREAQRLMNEVHSPHSASHSGQGNGKMRTKLKSLNQRRKSLAMKRGSSKDEDSVSSTGLPKPPKRRNSQVGLEEEKPWSTRMGKGKGHKGPHHRPTATFFKKAVGDHPGSLSKNGLNIGNAKHDKELQMVSQALSSDLAQKAESMQNLQMANRAMMQKMESMQQEMEQMKVSQTQTAKPAQTTATPQHSHAKNESTNSISDLP